MDVLGEEFLPQGGENSTPLRVFCVGLMEGNKVGTLVFPGLEANGSKESTVLGEARRHGHAGSDGRYGGQGRRDEHRRHSKEGAHRFAVETSAGLEKAKTDTLASRPSAKALERLKYRTC